MSRLAVFLLGPPRVELDGAGVELQRHKVTALLAYLLVTDRPHRRDTLAAIFWPDDDQSHARAALRRTLSALNTALNGVGLAISRETIGLERDAPIWLDVARFRALLSSWRAHGHPAAEVCADCLPALSEAVALYHTDFMAGFSLRDSAPFDEWQMEQAEQLRRGLSEALERLTRGHSARREWAAAIEFGQRWVTLDPLHEAAHRLLMQVYVWSGERAAALRQYHTCMRLLDQELGAQPEPATEQLYQQIHSGQPPAAPAPLAERSSTSVGAASAPPSMAAPLDDLPAQSTPFLGREAERAEISQRLADPGCRLLTLIGPGGVGKTRLALQALADLDPQRTQGSCVVPLAHVETIEGLIATLTDALDVPLYGRTGLKEQLLAYVQSKHLLLVLDNFEQLVHSAELLAELLDRAPGITCLVTSRERLHLPHEWLIELHGLRVPQSLAAPDADEYSAVQLFVQRAQMIDRSFALQAEVKPDVVRICQLVEGLPLGIELAAAWIRTLTCQEIAAELLQSSQLLATSRRGLPERHRSLRAVFDYSWKLLSDQERTRFRKLSIFHGRFRRQAAEQVAETGLPLLSALIDKSLIRRSTTGYYELHHVVRQYASEQLQQVPSEHRAVQERHCRYYSALLEQQAPRLSGAEQNQAGEEIAAVIEDVRAGWHWAVEQRELDSMMQALDGLFQFYSLRSWFQESAAMIGYALEALGQPVQSADEPRRRVLCGRLMARLGTCHGFLGEYQQARKLLETSLPLLQGPQQQADHAFALLHLGMVAYNQGQYAEALERLTRSRALYQALDDQQGEGRLLNLLGYIRGEIGEHTEAEQLLEEGLLLCRRSGSPRAISSTLNSLGYVLYRLGSYDRAQELLEESLMLRRSSNDRYNSAITLDNLGYVQLASGALAESLANFQEALQIATELRAAPVGLDVLAGIAASFAQAGQTQRAVEILTLVLDHPARWKETQDRGGKLLAQLTADLDSYPATRQHGITRTYDQLVAEVLAMLGQYSQVLPRA